MFRTRKLHRLLAVPAALVAVLAFAPAATAASTPTTIEVGGVADNAWHDITGVNKGNITASLGGLDATCTSANPVGYAADGDGVLAADPYTAGTTYMRFSDLGLTGCTGIEIAPVNITNNCDAEVRTTPGALVTDAMVDDVDSVLFLGTVGAPCLHVQTVGFPCSMDIYGTTPAVFHETPKGTPQVQDLSAGSTGLFATNVTNPGCLFIVNNGDPVTFNLTVNLTSPDGLINFKCSESSDPDC
ncbi:hypothetical protein [Nocardioides humi]|uniref:Neocarzinostatin family protein n=1 Tax=Nocardioides humi TaxID=449461 RepID=A0ABN2AWK9_9ACTN|nr:hypothetical protein [Nocardioides humi]